MLNWNQEYAIKFNSGAIKFFTPNGKGFSVRFEAESEKKRLISKGFTNVEIYIRKWS